MTDEQKPRRPFPSFRLSTLALICVAVYVILATLSVIFAHAMFVVRPQSGWAERVIAPVVRGIEFLDAHWKAVLILVAPFAAPAARALIPRLRKAWGLEFDPPEPLPLESEGSPREKPTHSQHGGAQ